MSATGHMPGFFQLWRNYPPTDGPGAVSPQALKARIGGRVDTPRIVNTCCIRLSDSLNRSGDPIAPRFRQANLLPGGVPGSYYFTRVADVIDYLTHRYGRPRSATSRVGFTAVPNDFYRTGIIAFWWGYGHGSTGHVDIWDGTVRRGNSSLIYPGHGQPIQLRSMRSRGGRLLSDGNRLWDQYWSDAREVHLWVAN